VDHAADIRGLVTARLVFVAELPVSILAGVFIPLAEARILFAVVAPLPGIWRSLFY